MKSKKIVFVLGAGASVDLDLPMGAQLTEHIRDALDIKKDDFGYITGGDATIRSALTIPDRDVNRLLRAANLIAESMPLAASIDNFVDVHRETPEIAYCAKLAIAKCILAAERSSTIFVDEENFYNTINFVQASKSWHTLFFRMLTQYCTASNLASRLREIAVVSFNYDRCFEHFLFHAIKTYYRLSSEAAADILRELEIFHPYGKVGALPYFTKAGEEIPYGMDIMAVDLVKVAKQIRTFTEGSDPTASNIITLRDTVYHSKKLVFLGFAYHPLNVELLFGDVDRSGHRDYEKRILGTAFGSSKKDAAIISSEIQGLYNCDKDSVDLRIDLKCDALFSEYSRTISPAEFGTVDRTVTAAVTLN